MSSRITGRLRRIYHKIRRKIRPKKIDGIRIDYQQLGNTLKAYFYVDNAQATAPDFVSNKEIRQAIRKSQFNEKQYLGFMELDLIDNVGKWHFYNPFHGSHTNPIFSGKGIGGILEFRVMQEMKKRFPQLKKFKHVTTGRYRLSEKRKSQLLKRGLDFYGLREGYVYETAVGLLRKKIANDTIKGRASTLKPNAKRITPR